MLLSRIVSISSILGALTVAGSSFLFHYSSPLRILASAIALFVLWTHRQNIRRLWAGTEPKLHRIEKVS
jgi:glycerol-3-phosphate acyltransferase PlsY